MPTNALQKDKDIALYKLPPHNIEAEQSLLSAVILDNRTLLDIIEILSPEDFYTPSHQKIFDAITELFRKSEPVDPVTLNNMLVERGQIDDITGENYRGTAYLAWLTDAAPRAVNAPHYAKIVRDKACLRRLIEKASEITQRCYEDQGQVDEVINFAESAVFEISENKINPSFHPLGSIIEANIDTLEERQGNKSLITGVPTGFSQLDKLTAGFQPSDLIILAARPSMGKCCEASTELILSDGSITTIGEICQGRHADLLTLNRDWKFHMTRPSDFVDDGKKPVFRVTTRTGRFVETTLTHPFLTLAGWKPLAELKAGDKIAVPRKTEVFGTQRMRECEVRLLAYLTGDGNLTNACPRFTNTNPRILSDFIKAAEEFGGVRAIVSESADRAPDIRVSSAHDFEKNRRAFADILKEKMAFRGLSGRQFAYEMAVSPAAVSGRTSGSDAPSPALFDRICNFFKTGPERFAAGGYGSIARNHKNALTVWLEKLRLMGKNAHDKVIPDPVFRLPRPLMALFLNRLFATDGWASVLASGQVQLGYSGVSEKLIRQVQHLLLRFGIIARVRKRRVPYADKRRTAWQLDITDAISIRSFAGEIGIFGKEAALKKVRKALAGKNYQSNTDLIPAEIWDALADAKGEEPWSQLAKRAGIAGWSNIHVGKRAMKRDRLAALAKALDNKALQRLAESEVYWDEIVSVEFTGNKQVYDLTIPETHNFVANDICVHNTAFALNLARNAAVEGDVPVGVFSLEMSKEQLSMRMLCAEARVDSSRLRSGYFNRDDWDALTDAAGVLSEAPIYIDDSADVSAIEIRAKARRLKMEKGLGMLIIDYMQLMKGRASAERRDLEISEISRSLKALAKELNIPVIALSQLNRKLEERADKRPMLSDLRESGCLTGDTLIPLATGERVPIKALVSRREGAEVFALNETSYRIEKAKISNAFSTGTKPVYQLTTASGRTIRATANHKFRTPDGWCRLDRLNDGDYIATPGSQDYETDDPKAVMTTIYIYWDKIRSVRYCGEEETFDLTVPVHHNFIANNIIAHNSIEQDADVVAFIYRDEVYNKEENNPNHGKAEIILGKQRNGPIGTAHLIFLNSYTRFEDVAPEHMRDEGMP